MYTEFIIIYIALGLILAISIVNFIMILLLKRNGSSIRKTFNPTINYSAPTNNIMPQEATYNNRPSGNIVFCKNCATEFDSSARVCPRCGTPR